MQFSNVTSKNMHQQSRTKNQSSFLLNLNIVHDFLNVSIKYSPLYPSFSGKKKLYQNDGECNAGNSNFIFAFHLEVQPNQVSNFFVLLFVASCVLKCRKQKEDRHDSRNRPKTDERLKIKLIAFIVSGYVVPHGFVVTGNLHETMNKQMPCDEVQRIHL